MGAAGTYQFLWSSLSGVVATRVPASETALGTVFTAFVVTQTLVQLPAGGIRDRYGPRRLLPVAGVCLFAGFAGVGLAPSLPVVGAAYAVGGVGSGIAYTVAVNTPVKWFGPDDRRGLATGAVTMSYAAVSVVAIPLVGVRLASSFTRTLVAFGALLGAVGLLAGLVLRDPEPGNGKGDDRDADHGSASDGDADPGDGADDAVGWRTTIRTWQFWVLYAVMLLVNGVGLMMIGQSVGLANGLGLSAATATTAASVVAAADGAGILVVGGVSDRFGGARTLAVSLVCSGAALATAVLVGGAGAGLAFVVALGGAAFFRSPAFAIVPTLVGSYYGVARSSENYAAVYTSKAFGGVVGGTVAAALVAAVGWTTAFLAGAALLGLSGVLAGLLRPVDGGAPDAELEGSTA
jgi:OFA family oxalate/formate antiporter-like MFS transporter